MHTTIAGGFKIVMKHYSCLHSVHFEVSFVVGIKAITVYIESIIIAKHIHIILYDIVSLHTHGPYVILQNKYYVCFLFV